MALRVNGNNVTYFDSFGHEHIPKEITEFIRNRNYLQIFTEYKSTTQ